MNNKTSYVACAIRLTTKRAMKEIRISVTSSCRLELIRLPASYEAVHHRPMIQRFNADDACSFVFFSEWYIESEHVLGEFACRFSSSACILAALSCFDLGPSNRGHSGPPSSEEPLAAFLLSSPLRPFDLGLPSSDESLSPRLETLPLRFT
jgi:hypothetical protein